MAARRVEELAIVKDYNDLVVALYARAEQLNVARHTVDDIAGFPDGYASKLLRPKHVRRIGFLSLGPMLAALGVKLVLVEDRETMAKYAARRIPRDESCVRRRHQPQPEAA